MKLAPFVYTDHARKDMVFFNRAPRNDIPSGGEISWGVDCPMNTEKVTDDAPAVG